MVKIWTLIVVGFLAVAMVMALLPPFVQPFVYLAMMGAVGAWEYRRATRL